MEGKTARGASSPAKPACELGTKWEWEEGESQRHLRIRGGKNRRRRGVGPAAAVDRVARAVRRGVSCRATTRGDRAVDLTVRLGRRRAFKRAFGAFEWDGSARRTARVHLRSTTENSWGVPRSGDVRAP